MTKNFSFGSVGPGESLEFGYDYFATASTGFGETAVFAAIGDPFDLTAGGGHFEFQLGGAPTPSLSRVHWRCSASVLSLCWGSGALQTRASLGSRGRRRRMLSFIGGVAVVVLFGFQLGRLAMRWQVQRLLNELETDSGEIELRA